MDKVQTSGDVWPEQEAVDIWWKSYQQELKELVTRPRIETQRMADQLLQRVKELEAENKKLRQASDDMREELVSLYGQIGVLKAARNTLLDELDWAKRNRDSRIRELEVQRSAAMDALEKLRDLLPEFGSLDGKVWQMIDGALTALARGEQG
ncbi:MAG: hypothetical protein HPY52_16865 [Firmicutes bacterium]|nr:hypothetical protein [Bacillota bacterium]